MFSMFFGAGNVIFPLIVGQSVGGGLSYALIGLLLTAVLMPFSGLLSITLFEGDYMAFFRRMGKWPGLAMSALIIALIGPFGAAPRCVTLTYSSLKFYVPELGLVPFTIGALLLIFFCCVKKQRIIDILGVVLTPLLLVFLGVIVIKGVFFSPHQPPLPSLHDQGAFFYGLKGGYNTMDLLAGLFFSSIICARLKKELEEDGLETGDRKVFLKHFAKAAALGAFLLGVVYIGFGTLANLHSSSLGNIPPDQLLGSIGSLILGPYAGFIVCMAVVLSCLTTAIALAAVSAEFLQKVTGLSYRIALSIVLLLTGLVSMLEFSGIVRMLGPVLEICYPALIGLSILNILHKTFKVEMVKLPIYGIICWMLINAL